MASLKTLNSGFSVLEILITISLLAVIGCFCLFADAQRLCGMAFGTDRDAAVGALRRARGLAMSNVCVGVACDSGKSHGVHFDPAKKEFIIFQGDNFVDNDLENEIIEFQNAAVFVDATSAIDVVFERLSGDANPAVIVLKGDREHIATISVNEVGQIDY